MYVPHPIDTSGCPRWRNKSPKMRMKSGRRRESRTAGHTEKSATIPAKPVPYRELPENEKRFDRLTETATLKLLLKMGYKITRA